jgi:hypothetical protein
VTGVELESGETFRANNGVALADSRLASRLYTMCAAATGLAPAPTHAADDDDGELMASPWIGLHYRSEGS